ncbi:MAG TPA: trehalose-6-phosphate synthase, partial [Acidobacteriaceae bacterium]|nr:trehalose-6-phosphate synthase [Acidobacteriaceae bacterium]
PYPISVAWDEQPSDVLTPHVGSIGYEPTSAPAGPVIVRGHGKESERIAAATHTALHRELGLEGLHMLLGVDRMDYTKGIVERLLGVENLLEEHPWFLEKIAFVQIAAPSRTHIPSYVELAARVRETVERINKRFETPKWKPVHLIERNCSHQEVARYYEAAEVCVVTALHDGMNLVAKEFLAAKKDLNGVLILSRFTGAAQELRDALLVNPYDTEQVGESMRIALEMSAGERRLRMERLRHQVKEHNVYRWASSVLTELCAVRLEDETPTYNADVQHRMLA